MKKGIKAVVVLIAVLLTVQALPVLAAAPKLSIKAEKNRENVRQLDVSCRMDNGEQISNGKLRIFYDGDKVELLSNEAGEVLADVSCEINDCLTGNKSPGELVVAFASSQDILEKGSILDMKFQLKDGVNKEDEILFEVKVEKLAGSNGDISVEDVELLYIVDKTDDTDKIDETDDTDDTNKNQDTNHIGSGNTGGNSNNQNSNNNNNNSNHNSNTSSNGSSVKTGDETPIISFILLGGAALLVICGIVAAGKRKCNEREE